MRENNHHDRLTLADYRNALSTKPARVPIAASLLGRFPIAMLGISMLFYIQHKSDSFALAGLVAAAQLTGVSIGSILQGRLIDRFGPTRPLLISASFFTVAIATILLCIEKRAPAGLLVVLSGVLGLSEPMVGSASRGLWSQLLPAGPLRNAAISYEAISIEVFFVLGPGLAGILVAAPWPGTGLVVGASCMLLGTVGFALSSPVRAWKGAVRTGGSRLWGPLASSGMRTVLVAAFGFGALLGFIEVAVPAASIEAGHPSVGGYLLSGWSISSVGFGLLYSLRPWPRSMSLRLPALMAAFALLVSTLAVPNSLWGLAIGMLIAGALIAPQSTAHSATIGLVASQDTAVEAFGWLTTAITLGLAFGQSTSGFLVEHSGPKASFLTAAILGLIIAAVLWFARNTIRSRELSAQV